MPRSILSIGRGRPMMAVEGTSIFVGSRPRRVAGRAVMRMASSRPRVPLEQLALPLLMMTAWARWRLRWRWSLQTATVCEAVLLVVKVAATSHSRSARRRAMSGAPGSDLMPHAVLPARKPGAALTPPSTRRRPAGRSRVLESSGDCDTARGSSLSGGGARPAPLLGVGGGRLSRDGALDRYLAQA